MAVKLPGLSPGGFRHRGEWIYPPVYTHVPDLGLVCDAPEGNHSPVLELERWDAPKLRFRPWQAAHQKAAPDRPKLFIFSQFARVAQSLRHDSARCRGDVNTDPLPPQLLCCYERGSTAAKSIQHDVVFITAGLYNAVQQSERLLRRVTQRFLSSPWQNPLKCGTDNFACKND
jgi:hypothetical protein